MKNELYGHFLSYFRFEPFPWIVRMHYKLSDEKALKEGCIIDLETTGLYPTTDMILTLGILKGNAALIYQLTNSEYDWFWGLCVRIVSRAPKPRYAYNTRFEADFLKIKDGWEDLTQYGERAYDDYERGPYYTIRLENTTLSPFKEPAIHSSEVPAYWKEWLASKRPKILYEIVWHNLTDLIRTRELVGR